MTKNLSDKTNRPSVKEVERYLNQWIETRIYQSSENCLNELFRNYSSNNKLNEIIVKVCALDTLFSTNVGRWFFEISNHILNYDFDTKLKVNKLDVNDFALVDILNKKTNKKVERNFYSFATKYCHFHSPTNDYPIYDSYVDKALWHFHNQFKFGVFARNILREHGEFKKILNEFRITFGLEKFTLREIDKYLWLVGKELIAK